MRIAVTYGPMCLLRSAKETWADPRTGSEIGWRRIVEGLRERGHQVEQNVWNDFDCVIAINEPDSLRGINARLRICMFWLNEFSFCKEGFDEHVDAYFSPSDAHLAQAVGPWGAPVPGKWRVNRLGCDVPRLHQEAARVPGRVVYCSSPDRGLHRVLEAWPKIRARVPQSSLRIFYRLEPFLRGFDETPYFPPIERNRARALYIEEALRRMSGPEWGIEVRDSISRDELQLELQQAEVFLHPCETLSWSEGFSCSTMEACANGAAPIVSDCDALGEVYAPLDPFKVGDWATFRERTIRALTDAPFRAELAAKATKLAREHEWKFHVQRLDSFLRERSSR